MAFRLGLAILVGSLSLARAGDVTGKIIIQKKLTRRNVTVSAPAYQRGAAVDLAQQKPDDPLVFERSHVVIYIEGTAPAAEPITAEIAQEGRQFKPDLVVVPVGSAVSFPNMDAIFHNVFSLSKPKSFDLGNYPKGQTRTVAFPKAGVVFVYCHLHPNMAASIVISPTRWYAKAAGDGNFRIPNVPPGTYTVVAWHKTAGLFRKIVTVAEGGAEKLEFLIPFVAENSSPAVAAR